MREHLRFLVFRERMIVSRIDWEEVILRCVVVVEVVVIVVVGVVVLGLFA